MNKKCLECGKELNSVEEIIFHSCPVHKADPYRIRIRKNSEGDNV